MEPYECKPSLLAAFAVTAKILAAIAAFALPIVIPAWVQGEEIAAVAIFGGAQLLGFWPAIVAAGVPAVQLAFTTYRFDDDGLMTKTQVLSKAEKRVAWEKVTALVHRRTVFDVLFGLERIDVVAYGERGATIHLIGLKDAAHLRDRVAGKMRESATVDALLRGD